MYSFYFEFICEIGVEIKSADTVLIFLFFNTAKLQSHQKTDVAKCQNVVVKKEKSIILGWRVSLVYIPAHADPLFLHMLTHHS
ncbi:hypothetical protein DC498_16430 [Terrimonas sp.]|nr:hypothetical protein DC498_16430 [Terrimonas sp.]